MSKPTYKRGKVRNALLIAPMAGLLGIVPFLFQLNLTLTQFLLVSVVALVVCYIGGLILGAPGYLILRSLGYSDTKYLMIYAGLLVAVTPILLDDVYALLSFGPPILLSAAAFCFIRGPAIDTASAQV